MAAHVMFMSPRGIGTPHAPGIGNIRLREAVIVPGVTNAVANPGEMVMVVNDDAATILAAYGSAPDAALLVETNASSAGIPVPTKSFSPPMMVRPGEKVSVKALA